MEKLSVLVLGDGLLGSEITKQTKWDYVSRRFTGFSIDDNLNSVMTKPYNVIINCIANTDTYSEDKYGHWDVNYKFVDKLIKFCNTRNIKLIHISTDYVYTGSNDNASENDVPVHNDSWYGYTKLLSDGLVQLQSKDYLLCRCTHIPTPFPYESAWTDKNGNFDYVDVIAGLIIKMIKLYLIGVYNVGTRTKTMWELAMETKKDVGKSLTPSYVPNNQTMNLKKLSTDLFNPFFSIAIPTYGYNGNGVEFLDFNLQILSEQTFKNFEIVISDHSQDDTIKDVYLKWSEKLNIIYVKNDKGRGIISPNINNAMRHCTGKWIKVLFQDDFLYDENSLLHQSNFLRDNPSAKWFMTTFFHSNTGTDFYRLYKPVWNDLIWTGNNTMGCPSGMTLRNEALILFNEDLNWLMDVDYYKRMYDKYGEPLILDKITAVNRTWGGRLCDTISQSLKDKELKMLTKKYA